MDAFFASVEQLDHPELRGKPVAVGGSGKGGVIAAASYEARAFGVRSALPSVIAQQRCPQLIFMPPRFERYKELSKVIRGIFSKHTDLIEPLSLDEAYLDISQNKLGIDSALDVAEQIRKEIFETTGLTASAGVSFNKFLAKTASDMDKPDGLTHIHSGNFKEILAQLPVRKFFGVGKVSAERLEAYGLKKGKDLLTWTEGELEQYFGKLGKYLFRVVRGEDHREVQAHRSLKSVGVEDTFADGLHFEKQVFEQLKRLGETLENRRQKKELRPRTLTLKVKYQDFTLITRSETFADFESSSQAIYHASKQLWQRCSFTQPIRLLGLQFSNFSEGTEAQLSFEFPL